MNNLLFILHASRPRFWAYLAGPFLLGYVAGGSSIYPLLSLFFFLMLLYFLLPANILLYGVNDYFDSDTDQFNEKKKSHEVLLKASQKRILRLALLLNIAISIAVYILLPNTISQTLFVIFILLSIFYSTPPLRFKSHPFIDSFSNILYIFPALIAYSFFSNIYSIPVILAMSFWAIAMHLYSAIPDIKSDTKANLKTTAVVLGEKNSLILCAVLYMLAVLCGLLTPLSYLSLIGLIYIILPLVGLFKPHLISKIYWLFPYINTILGFVLFLFLVLGK